VPQQVSVYQDQLHKLVKSKGEPTPQYETFTFNGHSKDFCGQVTVNKKTFTTYPQEFESENAAFEAAAKQAVEYYQKINLAPNFPETTDANLIAQRVMGKVGQNVVGNSYWSSLLEEKSSEECNQLEIPSSTSPNESREPIPAKFPDAGIFDVHVLAVLRVDQVS
jgi:hypothetical protein